MTGVMGAALKNGGTLALGLGLGLTGWALITGETALTRYYRRYTAHLDRSLHFLFLPGKGARIVVGQGVGISLSLLASVWIGAAAYGLALAAAFLPMFYLARKRAAHVRQLEAQMDGFLVALANALKTVPSPAAALGQLVVVLPSPMRLEIDRVLREMRVGGTLEQSLLNMSARLHSPDLDAALSSVLIGIQVGGNLGTVLESTGAALREMSRLEGVVRTRTSEGRAQLWVLGVFPFAICLALRAVDAEYFTPLQTTVVGSIVTGVALLLWLIALFTARKIMQVDL